MRTYARIVAEFAGDIDSRPDSSWKLIFDALLDGERIVPQRYFGYALEGDDGRWPMMVEKDGHFCFGRGADDLMERTNIFQKKIAPGELFTREIYGEPHTYRIVQVLPLLTAG